MAFEPHSGYGGSSSSEDSGFEHYSDNEIYLDKITLKKEEPTVEVKKPFNLGVEPILPPCKPLADSGHSLEADMLFG